MKTLILIMSMLVCGFAFSAVLDVAAGAWSTVKGGHTETVNGVELDMDETGMTTKDRSRIRSVGSNPKRTEIQVQKTTVHAEIRNINENTTVTVDASQKANIKGGGGTVEVKSGADVHVECEAPGPITIDLPAPASDITLQAGQVWPPVSE